MFQFITCLKNWYLNKFLKTSFFFNNKLKTKIYKYNSHVLSNFSPKIKSYTLCLELMGHVVGLSDNHVFPLYNIKFYKNTGINKFKSNRIFELLYTDLLKLVLVGNLEFQTHGTKALVKWIG